MAGQPSDPAVAATFDGFPEPARAALLDLRALIFETAAETLGVGPLTEALRWKQPSYLTQASGSGTTIRIDAVRGDPTSCALFVNCQTTLIESFRHLYADRLQFIGQREVRLPADAPLDRAALKHCIALALTYHAAKRSAA